MSRWAAAALFLLAGCVPTFDDRPWLIEQSRVLAIRASPPEARPGEAIDVDALVVTPDGPSTAAVQWHRCPRPRTSDERTAVTRGCADTTLLEPMGNPATLPADACARFGPNPPPTEGDAPPQRPSDPDSSGGYHFPIYADVASESAAAFGFVRLQCDLPNVTRATFEAYQAEYRLNANPQVAALSVDGVLDADNDHKAVAAASVVLEAFVPRDAFEPYLRYDPSLRQLIWDREVLTVRWYVSGGELSRDIETQDLAASDEGGPFATRWRLAETPGESWAWAVVVDSRGGVDWTALRVTVSTAP